MQLTVIIVNYNVRYFLEQCLHSTLKAIAYSGTVAEIIVVDNNSADNSVSYLQSKFPQVKFIINETNNGFAKACNQGLAIAKGQYILFLNPDTILPEDCFSICINFFKAHDDAGAIGVKMLDGHGRFLKESKRAFPSPVTSFFKLSGLAKLFSQSKLFSRYHLGHLNKNENHVVDVLAGAFMMVRKDVLDTVGGFDETFFMYGEDVDLSYRIQKAGYKNYYVADTSIIHFKGESTKKGSLNYVRMFYNAMSIFVKKHYGGTKAGLFNFIIQFAIWVRAAMSAAGRFIQWIGLPVIDALLIFFSLWATKGLWQHYVRTDLTYPNELLWIAFPSFTIMFLIAAYYAGLYDKWYKQSELIKSTLVATVFLLAVYSLLPERFRFSRAIIVLSAVMAFVLLSIVRWILLKWEVLQYKDEQTEHPDTMIVANEDEFAAVKNLLEQAGHNEKILGRVAIKENDSTGLGFYNRIHLLEETVPFREVIFCEGTLSYKNIIETLPQASAISRIKIHGTGTQSIVGSDSKDNAGETLAAEKKFRLADPYNLRIKRLIDISLSLFFLFSFFVHVFIVKKPFAFLGNCFLVLFAKKTWVGYAVPGKRLPPLRKGVIATNGIPVNVKQQLPAESLQMVDEWYARDYTPAADWNIIRNAYRNLGK